MPMIKQEIIEALASWAGDLQIAAERMTNDALPDEVRLIVAEMIALVQQETETPIWISGMDQPRSKP